MPPDRSAPGRRRRAPPPQPAMFRLHAPAPSFSPPPSSPVEERKQNARGDAVRVEEAPAGGPGDEPDSRPKSKPNTKPNDRNGPKPPAQDQKPAAKEPPTEDVKEESEDSITGEINQGKVPSDAPGVPPRAAPESSNESGSESGSESDSKDDGLKKPAEKERPPKKAQVKREKEEDPGSNDAPDAVSAANSQGAPKISAANGDAYPKEIDYLFASDNSDDDESTCIYPRMAAYAKRMKEKEEEARSRRGEASEAEGWKGDEGKRDGKNGAEKNGENDISKHESDEAKAAAEGKGSGESSGENTGEVSKVKAERNPSVSRDLPRDLARPPAPSSRSARSGDDITREASPLLQETQAASFWFKSPPGEVVAASPLPKEATEPGGPVRADGQGRPQSSPLQGALPESQASSLKSPADDTVGPLPSHRRRGEEIEDSAKENGEESEASHRRRGKRERRMTPNSRNLKSPPEEIKSRSPDDQNTVSVASLISKSPGNNGHSRRSASTMAEELWGNPEGGGAMRQSKRKRNSNEADGHVDEEESRRPRRAHKPSLIAEERRRNQEATAVLAVARRSDRSAAARKRVRPPKSFQLGARVEAKYHGRGKRYYPGEIVGVHGEVNRYDVDYDDGDIDRGLSAVFIRMLLVPIELVEVELSSKEEEEAENEEEEEEIPVAEVVSVASVASDSSHEPDRKLPAKGRRQHWNKRMALFRAHLAEHGTCDILCTHSVDPLLKNFVSEQRKQYKMFQSDGPSSLTEGRIAELKRLGFDFCPLDSGKAKDNRERWRQGVWDAQFAKLEEYKAKHGNCLVSTIGKHKKLGNWVRGQRKCYKKVGREGFDPQHLARLEGIGFDFNPLGSGSVVRQSKHFCDLWHKNYINLQKFKKKHGHCYVSRDEALGNWVHVQRKNKRKFDQGKITTLTEARIKLLDDVGLDWCPSKSGGRTKLVELKRVREWDAAFERLCSYKSGHGHANPKKKVKMLGPWASRMRSLYAKHTRGEETSLTDVKIAKLESIGFKFVAEK